jgi:hypothetical protein
MTSALAFPSSGAEWTRTRYSPSPAGSTPARDDRGWTLTARRNYLMTSLYFWKTLLSWALVTTYPLRFIEIVERSGSFDLKRR